MSFRWGWAVLALALLGWTVGCTTAGGAGTGDPVNPAKVEGPKDDKPKQPALKAGIYRVSDGAEVSFQDMIGDLEKRRVVFVGESHDNVAHHDLQRRVLEGLARRNPGRVALGMEMFQRPFQGALDAYTRQELDEAAMLEKAEYGTRWGFDFGFYRPMVELMRLQGSRVLALNAPKELTGRISKVGFEGLEPAERQKLPPVVEEKSAEHYQMVRAAFDSFHSGMTDETFQKFYEAQVTWDATMAEGVVEFLEANPQTTHVVVVAGMFHVQYALGIPLRLKLLDERLSYGIVIPVEQAADAPIKLEDYVGSQMGDYLWVVGP